MIERPKLKHHLHAELLGDERVLLIAEGRYFALNGRAHARVIPLADGSRTSGDIVDLLGGELSATEIYHSLLVLERAGHLEEACHELSNPVAAYWNTLGIDTRLAAERLAAAPIRVTASGPGPPSDELEKLLVALGLRVTAEGERLLVVVVDDYLDPALEALNEQSLAENRPWVLVKPNGIYAWVGPLFIPGQTGCWCCLEQRLRANHEVEEFAALAAGRDAPYAAKALLPSVASTCLGLAATEISKWVVTGHSETLEGQILSYDSTTHQSQSHVLVRRPQCSACGDGFWHRDRAPVPIELRSVEKRFVDDGGHRAVTPEETLHRFDHHVSPITGIAKGLFRVTDEEDPLLHVYVSGSNLATRHDSFDRLRNQIRGSCCGKGKSAAQAKASALGEALERYSGVYRGEEIAQRSTASALGERAIHPGDCMLFSSAQYRDRERWNAKQRRLDKVPLPFDSGAEIDWTPVWSVSKGEFRMLPTSYCYYSYPSPPGQFFCLPDSNGCAAGNTVEEAILQGFLELVERDSVAIWWYNRLRRRAIDLDGFDDPFIAQMSQRYGELERELWVLDLTFDLGIPACVAISRRIDRSPEDIIFAPAAHFDARMAVVRALTELNQMLPGVIDSRPDGTGYGYDDPEALSWWRTATIAEQPYLLPEAGGSTVWPSDGGDLSNDLLSNVELCQRKVEACGLEMLVLDQTRPDIGLPVVKVFVPSLRHFWARFAPGRLYDVPVEQGLLAEPLAEDELNPIPIFI